MEGKYFILVIAIPTIAVAITVSSNGNSPQRKLLGGMMVDIEKGFVPMKPTRAPDTSYDKSRSRYNNKGLALNERYRRLIPYMTFYYANDLVSPSKESYSTPNVEVQKVNIQEKAMPIRAESKIGNGQLRNVPVYRGNRLTQYNIASANPSKLIQYDRPPPFQPTLKFGPNGNVAYVSPNIASAKQPTYNQNLFYYQPIPVHPRKPNTYIHQATESPIIQYYPDDQKQEPQFKLVPYDQTPPIQMQEQSLNYQVYREQLKAPPQMVAADQNPPHNQQKYVQPTQQYKNVHVFKEPEVITSDSFNIVDEVKHENVQNQQTPRFYKPAVSLQHSVDTDFVPISNPNIAPSGHRLQKFQLVSEKPSGAIKVINPAIFAPEYSIENESGSTSYNQSPEQNVPKIEVSNDNNNITQIIETLQSGKKPTKENLTASIRTLLNILNSLKSNDQQYYELNTVEPILSTPTPFADHGSRPIIIEKVNEKIPVLVNGLSEIQKPILSPVVHQHPSQYLDADYPVHPQLAQGEDDYSEEDTPEGGTPGVPGVDYPLFTSIPETNFDCKTQRYKGFFGDPETHCQVWHYCDLNGGQASFLCPNGTIFSQVALTCDWWFNVKCSTTTQLYVLNERLYKYILPFTPKFPEDYSGPLVDKYLTIKFKEMEEKFKKNKKKNPTPTTEPEEMKEEKPPMVEVVTSSKSGELTPYKEQEPE